MVVTYSPEDVSVFQSVTENLTTDNGSSSEHDHFPQPEAYAVPIVFGLIFIIGVVGNGTLIFTVIRNKTMRNVPNIYIVSLASGDLLLILVSVPFTAIYYTFPEWIFGEFMCKFIEFLNSLSLGVSVFTLTALSEDRYRAIVDPMSKHMGAPMPRTMAKAGIIWFIACLLAVIEAVAGHVRIEAWTTKGIAVCNLYPKSWGWWYPKFHVMARFLIYFAFPMIIIAVYYIFMARILILSSIHMPGETHTKGQQHKQLEARKKVAKVVLSFVIIFVICWLPRHIYLLWWNFDEGFYNMFWHVFKILGFCLCFINSCVNPLALYFLSKQFRKYYNRYILCCLKSRRADREQSTLLTYNFNSTVRRTSTTMTMVQSQSVC